MPTCSRNWSWHHHQSATAVLKTRRTNIYCRDSNFCRQQEQMCGRRLSSYTPNSTAARRNWRRRLLSSCRLDSQCRSDREEEEDLPKSQAVVVLKKGWSLLTQGHIYIYINRKRMVLRRWSWEGGLAGMGGLSSRCSDGLPRLSFSRVVFQQGGLSAGFHCVCIHSQSMYCINRTCLCYLLGSSTSVPLITASVCTFLYLVVPGILCVCVRLCVFPI